MKTINKYLSLLSILFLISCGDLLDPNPTTGVSDDLSIYDKKSAQTALNGTYYLLKNSGYYGLNFQAIPFLFADNVKFTGIQTYYKIFIRQNGYGKTSLQSDNSALSSVWTAIYQTINNTNHLIHKVNDVADINFTQEERDEILGQAYFIRALCYFDLARYWGGVQLILQPTLHPDDVKGIKRSSPEQTYQQVLDDLTNAEKLLSKNSSRTQVGKSAADAFLARYHIYRKNWEKAEEYATRVIEDGNYTLVKPYAEFYLNKATSESVFELEYTTTGTNPSSQWWLPAELAGRYEWTLNDEIAGLLQDPATGGNRSEIVQFSEKSVLLYNGRYWRAETDNPEYLFRIAEQYLIRAEARAQQNNLTGSLDDLNTIRARADVPLIKTTDYNSVSTALLLIENERRIEFATEPHRFFDLARTGRLSEVLGEDDNYLFPIPVSELQKDPDLEPNPSN